MRDLARLRQIQNLEQKYDFSLLLKNQTAIETNSSTLVSIQADNANILSAIIINLDGKLDENITLWFYSATPTLANDPASSWTTDELKNSHISDLYYDRDTGYVYKFENLTEEYYLTEDIVYRSGVSYYNSGHTLLVAGTDYVLGQAISGSIYEYQSAGYTWVKQTDGQIIQAMALSNSKADTADHEKNVFFTQPVPPYGNGDWYLKDGELYINQIAKTTGVYSDDDWIIAEKATDDTVAYQNGDDLTILKGQVITMTNTYTKFTDLSTGGSTIISGDNITTGTLNASLCNITNINASNISTGTLSTSRLSSDVITTTNFSAQNINADKITSGTLSTSRLNSDVITTSNLSAQSISATQITTGTLSADRIASSSISATKLSISTLSSVSSNLGSITAGSININGYFSVSSGGLTQMSTSGGGFMSLLNSTHPYASALNIGYGSGGLVFKTGTSQSSVGSTIGQIYMSSTGGNMFYECDGAMHLKADGTININNGSGGNVGIKNLTINGSTITGENGGSMYANSNCDLNPTTGYYAYVGSTSSSANRIAVSISGPSSLNVKENLVEINEDDIYKDIQEMKLYDFDYKYEGIKEEKHDFGFIIDYIEESKTLSNYAKNIDTTWYIKDNRLIKRYDDTDDDKYELFHLKEWDRDSYIKLLFVMVKSLQLKIDEIERRIQ